MIALLYCDFKATSSTLSPNDLIHFEYGFVIELFAYVLFGIPALLLELSGIRSVYRILKYQPRGAVKICLLIAAILSFSAFLFQALMFTGVLDFTQDSGSLKLQQTVLLLTGLPVVLVSFVLVRQHTCKTGRLTKHYQKRQIVKQVQHQKMLQKAKASPNIFWVSS